MTQTGTFNHCNNASLLPTCLPVTMNVQLKYNLHIVFLGNLVSLVLGKSLALIHTLLQIKEKYQYFYLISDIINCSGWQVQKSHMETNKHYDSNYDASCTLTSTFMLKIFKYLDFCYTGHKLRWISYPVNDTNMTSDV